MAKGYAGVKMSYTPVEYIESSGTQYIDTGVVRDITKKFRFVASVKWDDVQTRQCIGAQGYVYFGVSGGKYQIAQGGTTTTNINATTSSFADIDLTFNCPSSNCTGTVNSTSIGTISVTYLNSPENAHIHLFSLNDLALPCSVKIASFQIYQNDVLVRDFIPVVDQDNIACLYDLVEGKLYYNKGTGTFAAGSEIGQLVYIGDFARKLKKGYAKMPTSYTPIEYIESTGAAYIDTEFKANNNTRVVFDFSPISVTSEWAWAFGGRNGYHNADYTVAFNASTWYSGFGGTDYRPTPAPTANTRYLVDKNKNVTTINGTSYTNSAATFQSDYNLLLLGASDGTTVQRCNAKLYSCKVYDNETLIRDFFPVLDYNNVACLYEQVEGKFYYNKGIGPFIAGSATGQAVSIGDKARRIIKGYARVGGIERQVFADYTLLDYIESDGNQWIDTGVVYDYATTQFDIDFQYLSSDSAGYISVSWSGSSHDAYVLASNSTGSIICATAQIDSWTPIATKDTNRHQHTYNDSSHQIIYDGRVISNRTTVNVNGVVTMRIFRGPGSNNPAKARIYGYKISNIVTQELIRDFIPVLDDSGVPCLYDKVSHTFFYNQGTGTFLYN